MGEDEAGGCGDDGAGLGDVEVERGGGDAAPASDARPSPACCCVIAAGAGLGVRAGRAGGWGVTARSNGTPGSCCSCGCGWCSAAESFGEKVRALPDACAGEGAPRSAPGCGLGVKRRGKVLGWGIGLGVTARLLGCFCRPRGSGGVGERPGGSGVGVEPSA